MASMCHFSEAHVEKIIRENYQSCNNHAAGQGLLYNVHYLSLVWQGSNMHLLVFLICQHMHQTTSQQLQPLLLQQNKDAC